MEVTIQDLKRTMARHGIQLIAEKIESEAKLLEVLDLDVDYGQGYLFGEPQLDIQPAAA
jgi:cyclic-di-GMP phosphodiesterase TipF (flagellum assembly factor)